MLYLHLNAMMETRWFIDTLSKSWARIVTNDNIIVWLYVEFAIYDTEEDVRCMKLIGSLESFLIKSEAQEPEHSCMKEVKLNTK